jgi:hypothetical protein
VVFSSLLWVREVSLDNLVLVFSEEVWNDEVPWWMQLHPLLNTSRLHNLMNSPMRSGQTKLHPLWWEITATWCLLPALLNVLVVEVTLCQEEQDMIGSHSTSHFEHDIWPCNGSCSLVFSYSVILEWTVWVASHWSVRTFPLPLLGEFRGHTWASSEFKTNNLVIGLRKPCNFFLKSCRWGGKHKWDNTVLGEIS